MRGYFALAFFVFGMLFASMADAQGWLWGRGSIDSGIDAWCVASDPSGNVFAGGISYGHSVIGNYEIPFSGIQQSVVAKYDGAGNFLWANGTKTGNSTPINLASDQHGNLFLFGVFQGSSFDTTFSGNGTLQIGPITLTNPFHDKPQYFLAKFDPSGNVLWAVNAGPVSLTTTATVISMGAIATDAAGNVYITTNYRVPTINISGYILTNSNPSSNSDDILLVKYDPSGSVVWATSAGGSKSDDAYGITVTPAGDIYIAGVSSSPSVNFGSSVMTNMSSSPASFIARFNSSGHPVWGCSSGGTGGDYACGIASDANNNVYMTGGVKESNISFSGTAINNPYAPRSGLYLVKFDPSNNMDWSRTIGWPPVVYPTDSGNIFVGGGAALGFSVTTSVCGQVWVSGAMTDTVMVEGNVLVAPAYRTDPALMAGYTTEGTCIASVALASGGDDQNGIACDPSGNVFFSGDYASSPFILGVDHLPTPMGEELFVGKYAAPKSAGYIHSSETFCLNAPRTATASSGYSSYTWNDGVKGNARLLSDTGTYLVFGENKCLSASIDTFHVIPACDCGKSLFVPNAFTPNGDGQDDVFYPRTGPGIDKIKSFRVYNRWGELLFDRENIAANDASNAWDGTYRGDRPLPDVYVWVVDAICENGSTINKKGSITIIR